MAERRAGWARLTDLGEASVTFIEPPFLILVAEADLPFGRIIEYDGRGRLFCGIRDFLGLAIC